MSAVTADRRRRLRVLWITLAAALTIAIAVVAAVVAASPEDATDGGPGGTDAGIARATGGCEFWVATSGDDDRSGTRDDPWATLEHAAAHVPDQGCTVWFAPGTYQGGNHIDRRFTTTTVFRSQQGQRAVLEHDGEVIDIDGGRNIVIRGFELRHSGPEASRSDYVAIVDRSDDTWSEHITFADNVIHDSYGDDLLKLHNGTRFATVAGNVFYNQGENEQHLDINSATDVEVRDNIFFNDYAGSDRTIDTPPKHFIVVKDSNEDEDGLEGSERITIRRNVLLNWEGAEETFIQIGNDGKPYHEATDVLVENNLLIGNSATPVGAAFGVRGARGVAFNNNTVAGDLPGKAYAYRITLTGDNPVNDDIRFTNNIWFDPAGTMGAEQSDEPAENEFADGSASDVTGLRNDTNLYWNGGAPIPSGEAMHPERDDPNAVVADPEAAADQSGIVLPRWTADGFADGGPTIRDAFVRLVEGFGAVPESSPAVDAADPETAARDDILGTRRTAPDLGAYEATAGDG
ncbi:MAG TPA: hypothetical protein VK891_12500 [Euzebyales bacterium]|nr:hypothetical protein [Euzebyales bacterium]